MTSESTEESQPADKLRCCQVCSKPGAAIRYRKYACNACRVFFSRAVTDSGRNTCFNGGSCIVHYLNIKKNCYACRLRKCHEAGMESSDVGKKGYYDRVVPRFTEYEWNACVGTFIKNNISRGARSIMNMQMNYGSISNYVEMLRASEMWFLNGTFPLIMTVNPVLNFPDSFIAKNISLLDYLSNSAFETRGHYKILASTCRIMIASSELMCLVTEFKEMRDDDKERLMQYNGRDLAILFPFLTMIDKRDNDVSTLHSDSCSLVEYHMTENCGESSNPLIVRLLLKIKETMEEINATTKELHILLLIILFQPNRDQTVGGYQLTLSARTRLSFILGCLIRDMNFGIGKKEVTVKLQHFLKITQCVKEASSFLFPATENTRHAPIGDEPAN